MGNSKGSTFVVTKPRRTGDGAKTGSAQSGHRTTLDKANPAYIGYTEKGGGPGWEKK